MTEYKYSLKELKEQYNLTKYYVDCLCKDGYMTKHGKTCGMKYIFKDAFTQFDLAKYKEQKQQAISQKISKRMLLKWSNQEFRQSQSKSIAKAWTEDKRLKQSLRVAKAWTEDKRLKQSIVQKERFKDEQYKEQHRLKTSIATKKAYDTHPEYHEKLHNANIIKWSKLSFREKRANTLKERHKQYSKWEDYTYELLLTKFKKEDIKRQYFDKERYPFKCDFYIESLDLFIECHYSEFHQYEPFNSANNEHIKRLNELQEKANLKFSETGKDSRYHKMIYTWTDLDIRKANCAKDNNLNWIAFYALNEFNSWFNKERFSNGRN